MDNKKNMHLALFLPSLRGGGAERVLLNLSQGFVEQGYNVDLVLQKAEGPYLSHVPDEVRLIDLKAKRMALALFPLVSYLCRERPTAMLVAQDHANLVALCAKHLARVPTRLVVRVGTTLSIASTRAPVFRARVIPLLTRLFYRWADAVVAVSQGVANDLISLTKLPPDKVRVIYNPVVTHELFERAEEPLKHPWFAFGEPPVVLGVGRLTEAKDFSTLIRAFSLVRSKWPARLVILGEGEERPKLEALVRELELEKDVDMPGFVENPYPYMKRAAVFVLSSRWEGLPNVLIEALALGTPVVSTDCPSGPNEILAGGEYGILVPVRNHELLAKAIEEQLALRKKNLLAKEAIHIFTMNKVLSQYLEVLGGNK